MADYRDQLRLDDQMRVSMFDQRGTAKPQDKQSMKSCDLDDDEIDEFNLQQEENFFNDVKIALDQPDDSKTVYHERDVLPVRRLDFTNLPPGTPPF